MAIVQANVPDVVVVTVLPERVPEEQAEGVTAIPETENVTPVEAAKAEPVTTVVAPTSPDVLESVISDGSNEVCPVIVPTPVTVAVAVTV